MVRAGRRRPEGVAASLQIPMSGSAGGSEGTGLSPSEKVAAVLMTVGESSAAAILRHMEEKAVTSISHAMARMSAVDVATATNVMRELIADLDASSVTAPGGLANLHRLLASAFGDRRATEIIEGLMRSDDSTGDILSVIDPKTLADQLGRERPQLLAVLLGYMNKSTAVGFLANLPSGLATDVIRRFALMDTIQPAALAEMRAMLKETLGGHVQSKTATIGGIRNAAGLLNGMAQEAADQVLKEIREMDPDLAGQVRENMFTFEDVLELPDRTLQMVLGAAQPDTIAPALRPISRQLRERVYANVSKKASEILRDEVENGPRLTRTEARTAQRTILDAVMRLADEGKLSLRGEEEMV